jgi:hypothetical protein
MKNLDRHNLALSRSQFGLLNGLRFRQQAGSGRLVLLVLVAFALGLGLATYLFQRGSGSRAPANSETAIPGSLSLHTTEVLQNLGAPVEIRFYALLDPESVPASVQDFAGRVDSLLSEYAAVAEGKLKVVRYLSPSDAAANAASADRIKPFNLDKGNACFLGLALSCQDRKESIPQLAPEWEQALEPDLTRAILRLANPDSTPSRLAGPLQPDAAVISQVKSLLPDLASVSVEQGTQILREKAFATFADTAREMQSRVQEAQQRLAQARNSGSEADQQAALQDFQKVQAEQTDKLKEISAQLQEQIAALQYLKK